MPMIIGIHGKALSGKDTVGNILYEKYGFTIMPLAGPLKRAAAAAFGEDPNLFQTQEGKAGTSNYWGISRRKMLQDFGEVMCKEFGDEFWIKRWFFDYAWLKDSDHIVVTDVRKEVEANFLRSLGGTIVHLTRTGSGLAGEEANHKTEQGIRAFGGDVALCNDGTLADLEADVDALVARVLRAG